MDHDKQFVLGNDQERLLTFYDFPAEHRRHRRHRAAANRENQILPGPENGAGNGLRTVLECQAKWRKLDGSNKFADLIEGVPFKDGIK